MYEELVKRLRSAESNYQETLDCLSEAADAIEELSKPKWIPVSERLPKEMETVLITDGKNVGWSFCVNDYGTMEFYSTWKITHWMPLPEPPKEEGA